MSSASAQWYYQEGMWGWLMRISLGVVQCDAAADGGSTAYLSLRPSNEAAGSAFDGLSLSPPPAHYPSLRIGKSPSV